MLYIYNICWAVVANRSEYKCTEIDNNNKCSLTVYTEYTHIRQCMQRAHIKRLANKRTKEINRIKTTYRILKTSSTTTTTLYVLPCCIYYLFSLLNLLLPVFKCLWCILFHSFWSSTTYLEFCKPVFVVFFCKKILYFGSCFAHTIQLYWTAQLNLISK